jgi:hypothetical protein
LSLPPLGCDEPHDDDDRDGGVGRGVGEDRQTQPSGQPTEASSNARSAGVGGFRQLPVLAHSAGPDAMSDSHVPATHSNAVETVIEAPGADARGREHLVVLA